MYESRRPREPITWGNNLSWLQTRLSVFSLPMESRGFKSVEVRVFKEDFQGKPLLHVFARLPSWLASHSLFQTLTWKHFLKEKVAVHLTHLFVSFRLLLIELCVLGLLCTAWCAVLIVCHSEFYPLVKDVHFGLIWPDHLLPHAWYVVFYIVTNWKWYFF